MFLNDRGQTSVEYILLLAAIIAIMTSVMGLVRERLLGTGDCQSPQNQKALACKFKTSFDFEGNQFKYFTIKRFNRR